MRSMPLALLWETFSRGKWSLVGFFLLGNLMPLLIYTALSKFEVDTRDPAFIVLQFSFLPLIIFQFAIGIVSAQGAYARLFTMPISATSIAAWHTFSGAILLGFETAVAGWLYNAIFDINWPILGSALFAVTAWSASQPLLSASSQHSFSSFCVASAPVVFVFCWLQSRYGAWFSMPTHNWSQVTPSELTTMFLIVAVSFPMTVLSVDRVRSGERWLPPIGLGVWLVRLFESLPRTSDLPAFGSAAQAQFWYEWRLKGYALPILVGCQLVIAGSLGFGGLWFGQNTWSDIYDGILFCGVFVSLLAIGGGFFLGIAVNTIASGQRGHGLGEAVGRDPLESMGDFLGTRPLSNWNFAMAVLRTALLSSLFAWAMWFVGFIATLGLLWSIGQMPDLIIPVQLGAWFLPLTLLCPWIAMANVATIGLSGRGTAILIATVLLFVTCSILSGELRHRFRPSTQEQFQTGCVIVISVLTISGAAWSFYKAHREHLLGSTTLIALAAGFCTIVFAAIMLSPMPLAFAVYTAILAFAALVFMPVATTPLAIAWNRHR